MLDDVLAWMFFGLIAGGLAKLIMPGKDPGGCLVTIVIGIAGALLGGFLADVFFDFEIDRAFSFPSLLIAILGAVLLLTVYRLLVRPKR